MSDSLEHANGSSATGKAHYSDKWDQARQNEYNAWYYQQHKDKWKDSNEVAKVNTARQEISEANKNLNTQQKQYERDSAAAAAMRKHAISDPSKEAFKYAASTTATAFLSRLKFDGAKQRKNMAKEEYQSAAKAANKAIQRDMNRGENKGQFVLDDVRNKAENVRISKIRTNSNNYGKKTLNSIRDFSKKAEKANDTISKYAHDFFSGKDILPAPKVKKSTKEKPRESTQSWLDRTFGTNYQTTNKKAKKELSNKKYKKFNL